MKTPVLPVTRSLALVVGAIGLLVLTACMDRHPAGPAEWEPAFTSQSVDQYNFTSFRLVDMKALAPADSRVELQSVFAVSATRVYVSRADHRFFLVDVTAGSEQVISGIHNSQADEGTAASNYGGRGNENDFWGAGGRGNLFRHGPGGLWSIVQLTNGSSHHFLAIGGDGAEARWALGGDRGQDGNSIVQVKTGPTSWSNDPVQGNRPAVWAACTAGTQPYAVGNNGLILQRGSNNRWSPVTSGTNQHLRDIDCSTWGTLVVGANGTVRALRANSSTWVAASNPGSHNLWAVQIVASDLVFAAGDGGIFQGKITWGTTGEVGIQWTNIYSAKDLRDLHIVQFGTGTPVLFAAATDGNIVIGTAGPQLTVTAQTWPSDEHGNVCPGTFVLNYVGVDRREARPVAGAGIPATFSVDPDLGTGVFVRVLPFGVDDLEDYLSVWPLEGPLPPGLTPACASAPPARIAYHGNLDVLLTTETWGEALDHPLQITQNTSITFFGVNGFSAATFNLLSNGNGNENTVNIHLLGLPDGVNPAGNGCFVVTPGALRPPWVANPEDLPFGLAVAICVFNNQGQATAHGVPFGEHWVEARFNGLFFSGPVWPGQTDVYLGAQPGCVANKTYLQFDETDFAEYRLPHESRRYSARVDGGTACSTAPEQFVVSIYYTSDDLVGTAKPWVQWSEDGSNVLVTDELHCADDIEGSCKYDGASGRHPQVTGSVQELTGTGLWTGNAQLHLAGEGPLGIPPGAQHVRLCAQDEKFCTPWSSIFHGGDGGTWLLR